MIVGKSLYDIEFSAVLPHPYRHSSTFAACNKAFPGQSGPRRPSSSQTECPENAPSVLPKSDTNRAYSDVPFLSAFREAMPLILPLSYGGSYPISHKKLEHL